MTSELIPTDVEYFLIDEEPDLKKKLSIVIDEAKSIEVLNDGHFRKMTKLYGEAKDWEKRIDFIRKEANQPDQERINARNDKAREILMPLKLIQSIAKEKCERYQLILDAAKAAEEKKVQDAVDLLGLDVVPLPMPVEKTVRGDGAMMYTRTVRKFRIVDQSQIPTKYLTVDVDAIERDLKLGVAEIPGIEMYEEKQTNLRTR